MTPPNVLLHLSAARPHMGGGAISLWRVAEELARRGFPVRVTAERVMSRHVRGVRVERPNAPDARWADVVLTGAGEPLPAVFRAARRRARVIAFVHSAVRPLRCRGANLVVWGSEALRARASEAGFRPDAPEAVLWPPLDADAVRVEGPGECITLVNLMPEKGAELFWRLAHRMPDLPFLGVQGGWDLGRQLIPHPLPANAQVMKYSPDPRPAYARTRALLYLRGPDAGPGWLNGVGLAAIEAALSGIPTIAHPGAGLVESLADAGTWVDSDDPADWEAAIRAVLDPAHYAERSAAARGRAAAYEAAAALDPLVTRILELAA